MCSALQSSVGSTKSVEDNVVDCQKNSGPIATRLFPEVQNLVRGQLSATPLAYATVLQKTVEIGLVAESYRRDILESNEPDLGLL